MRLRYTRDLDTPEDLGNLTFLDTFSDVFTPPDWQPRSCGHFLLDYDDYCFWEADQAGRRMRAHFDWALGRLDLAKGLKGSRKGSRG